MRLAPNIVMVKDLPREKETKMGLFIPDVKGGGLKDDVFINGTVLDMGKTSEPILKRETLDYSSSAGKIISYRGEEVRLIGVGEIRYNLGLLD